MVLNRWGKKLTEKQKEFIEKNNGFPECYDIIGIKKMSIKKIIWYNAREKILFY